MIQTAQRSLKFPSKGISQFNGPSPVSGPRQQADTVNAAAAWGNFRHANGRKINDSGGFALVHWLAVLLWDL